MGRKVIFSNTGDNSFSTAQTWEFHDTAYVDHYTSTRVVRKPRDIYALSARIPVRAPCTAMLCGDVCGVGR